MAKGKIVDVKPSKDGGWDVGAGPALPFRPHERGDRRGGGTVNLVRLLSAVVIVFAVGACGRPITPPRSESAVVNEYKRWSIRVTPSFDSSVKRWQARVEVWPPENPPESRPGIFVHFSDRARERAAVEQAAVAVARRYIDASIAVHR